MNLGGLTPFHQPDTPTGYSAVIEGQKRLTAPPATLDHARRPVPCGVLQAYGGNVHPFGASVGTRPRV